MAVASTRSTPSDDVSLELAKDVVTASETADSEKLGHEEAGESVREYPRGSQLWLVSIALYVGGFLICLVSFNVLLASLNALSWLLQRHPERVYSRVNKLRLLGCDRSWGSRSCYHD